MGDFSYEHLFDVLRKERAREELQELEDDFYIRAQGYVAAQSSLVREFDVLSDQAEKARQQLSNAKKLLKELYDRREKKILLLALNKAKTNSSIIDTSALLEEEKQLFTDIVTVLSTTRNNFSALSNSASQQSHAPPQPAKSPTKTPETVSKPPVQPAEPKEVLEGVKVTITGDVPRFMGSAQETFGPFKQGEEAVLPEKIAQILVKKGRAEHA